MKCTYKVKMKDGEIKLFNSEMELDSFLSSYMDKYKVNELDKTFYIDPTQNTVNIIKDISKQCKDLKIETVIVNENGETEKKTNIPGSVGVTSFIQTYGNVNDIGSPLVTPFDINAYLKLETERLRIEGRTDKEIKELLDIEQNNWNKLTDYGTDIHKLFESILKGESYKCQFLTESQQASLTEQFKDLKEYLLDRHGSRSQFLSEVPLISKNINDAYKAAHIDSINGVADLIVIDEQGIAHIYDFKVSPKDVGKWEETRNDKLQNKWHSSKKRMNSLQLCAYGNILRQYGISVGESSVIPIKLELNKVEDTKEITGIARSSINIDFLSSRIDQEGIFQSLISTSSRLNMDAILPTRTLLDNVDLVESIQEPMTKIVPNYELTTNLQRKTVTVERYRQNRNIVQIIPEGDKDRDKGKYIVYNKFKKNPRVYCQTEDEVTEALQSLVTKENAQRGDELFLIADTITRIKEGTATAQEFDTGNKSKADYCNLIFRKYLRKGSGWKFENNPKFIAAGIFCFTKNGEAEVISLTYSPTHEVCDLGKGTTILGAKKANHQVDEHKVLSASNGNIDLIKVMCLINNNIDNFTEQGINKIAKISSFNIWLQTGIDTYLETLYDNFANICNLYDIPLNLKKSNFSTTLESSINDIRDICDPELMISLGKWDIEFDPDSIVYGVPFLLEKISQLKELPEADGLRKAISSDNFNFDDPLQLAYILLHRALNKLYNFNIYIEKDPALWIGGNILKGEFYTGININSPGTAASLNIQELSKIFSIAETHIRRKELSFRPKYIKAIREFYKYNDRNRLIGGEVRYFDNLFVKDENGNIDKSFKLKKPTDSNLSKEEANFINVFLEIINDLKYKGNTRKIEQAKEDGSYYEVPLVKGETSTQVYRNGFIEAAKTRWEDTLNWLQLLPGQESELTKSKKEAKTFNKYKISAYTRTTLIDRLGVNKLETQLENILLDYIHSYVVEDVMDTYLPMLQSIKVALQYQQAMFGVVTKDTVDYINKYLSLNVFSKPIMNPQLHSVYKALNVIKQVTTATTLGLNVRSGLKELLQGMWIHISRTMAESYGKDQFTNKDIAKAWNIIFKESFNDPNIVTLIDALNIEYGMANADMHQIQDRLSSSRTGIKNFDSDALYICNKIPDAYHRLGLLIAKMIHDGCWEAISLKDDILVYDFKKDKRFSELNNPNANKKTEKYRSQKALYNVMRDQFNKEGWNLKDGEDLPRAYTIQENTSIKSFSELCFGHYDRSTQMLAKSTFLGAFWLHFKTFLSAKLEQWILKPGTYNQGNYDYVTNDDGIRLVQVFEGEDESGMSKYRYDLETNMTKDDNYILVKEWKGRWMEGIAYSMCSFGKALLTMDTNKWNELWANPTKRANFKLFLHDMIWSSLIMWIIQQVFLTPSEGEEISSIQNFIGTTLYMSYMDGPIHSVLSGMVGDLNPPSYTISKKIFNNALSILSGSENAAENALRSFGALKSFTYVGSNF